MTENNPPTGGDAFWDHPDATSPAQPPAEPDAAAGAAQETPSSAPAQPTQPTQNWGAFPPPDAYPPGNFSQSGNPAQPAGSWPQPGGSWPNQQPSAYPSGQAYAGQQPGYPPQQPGYPPQQPGYPPQQSGYAPQQPGYPAAPYAAPPAPQKPRRTGLIILLGVLGLCLVLVVGGLLLRPRTTPTSGPGPTTGGGGGSVATSASDAVQGYLQALAAGDATTALGYAATAPADTSLLTNDVLAASIASAPISDIQVEPSTASGFAQVNASYKLGGTDVQATYPVVDDGAGWKLQQVTNDVSLSGLSGLKVAVNGVLIASADGFSVFPGSYKITSGDDRYLLSGGELVIESPDAQPEISLDLGLSDTGRAAVRAAAQKKLTACIKENKIMPSDGCGFGVRSEDQNGRKFTPKKVRWKITSGKDALKSAKVKAVNGDPTTVTGTTKVKLYVRIDATNGRWYWANQTISSIRATLGDGAIDVRFNE